MIPRVGNEVRYVIASGPPGDVERFIASLPDSPEPRRWPPRPNESWAPTNFTMPKWCRGRLLPRRHRPWMFRVFDPVLPSYLRCFHCGATIYRLRRGASTT